MRPPDEVMGGEAQNNKGNALDLPGEGKQGSSYATDPLARRQKQEVATDPLVKKRQEVPGSKADMDSINRDVGEWKASKQVG